MCCSKWGWSRLRGDHRLMATPHYHPTYMLPALDWHLYYLKAQLQRYLLPKSSSALTILNSVICLLVAKFWWTHKWWRTWDVSSDTCPNDHIELVYLNICLVNLVSEKTIESYFKSNFWSLDWMASQQTYI